MAKNTDLWKVLEQEGYDPGNPNDPVNELLRNIQEATPKTGPLTYVRNEENLLRFLVAYQNMALLAENHEGEWVDLNAEPEDAHFSIAVAFPPCTSLGKTWSASSGWLWWPMPSTWTPPRTAQSSWRSGWRGFLRRRLPEPWGALGEQKGEDGAPVPPPPPLAPHWPPEPGKASPKARFSWFRSNFRTLPLPGKGSL